MKMNKWSAFALALFAATSSYATDAVFYDRFEKSLDLDKVPVTMNIAEFSTEESDFAIWGIRDSKSEYILTVTNTKTQKVIYTSSTLRSEADLKKISVLLPPMAQGIKIELREVDPTFDRIFGQKNLLSFSPGISSENFLKAAIIGSYRVSSEVKGPSNTRAKFYFSYSPGLTSHGGPTRLQKGLRVIDSFSARSSELNDLFAMDSGVRENYTIREHSIRVLETYDRALTYCGDVYERKFPNYESLMAETHAREMQPILALHDIGKGLAARDGDRSRQHLYTAPIAEKYLTQFQGPKYNVRLAIALIDNDAIGEYVTGRISQDRAVQILKEQAQKAGVSLKAYFLAQTIYFTADAGSYPYLEKRAFTEVNDGCLLPRLDQDYWKLFDRIYP